MPRRGGRVRALAAFGATVLGLAQGFVGVFGQKENLINPETIKSEEE